MHQPYKKSHENDTWTKTKLEWHVHVDVAFRHPMVECNLLRMFDNLVIVLRKTL